MVNPIVRRHGVSQGAALKERRSILDYVAGSIDRLESDLGPRDRGKLSEYLDAIRDIERRIQKAEEQNAHSKLALPASDEDILELDDDDYIELEPAMAGGGGVAVEGDEDVSTVLVNRRHRTELDRLPGMEERMAAHADISDLIDRQPDDVAQLLRSWMSERR